MLWQGNVLSTQEDIADAMSQVQTKEEAANFRGIFEHDFPQFTDELLGYIAGHAPAQNAAFIKRLFNIKSPIGQQYYNEIPVDLFESGMQFASKHPALANIIISIPHRDWAKYTSFRRLSGRSALTNKETVL